MARRKMSLNIPNQRDIVLANAQEPRATKEALIKRIGVVGGGLSYKKLEQIDSEIKRGEQETKEANAYEGPAFYR